MTVLRYKSGLLSYAVAGLLCFIFLGIGLCCLGLIAFCINGLKDVKHHHPKNTTGGGGVQVDLIHAELIDTASVCWLAVCFKHCYNLQHR